MAHQAQNFYLVTIPLRDDSPDTINKDMQKRVEDGNCKLHRFEIPHLVVGTLDSLMALSDDLVKINTQVENTVRKVERQYEEMTRDDKNRPPLTVGSKGTVDQYMRKFEWDHARYQHQNRPLREIVEQVQQLTAKVDEELKKAVSVHTEKNLTVNTLQRRRIVNLATSDFEDFLDAASVAHMDILGAEEGMLKTMMVAMPAALEKEFLRIYSTIGDDIALFGETHQKTGPNSGRDSVKGSPVADGSAKLVHKTADMVLYSIVVLKGHTESGYFAEDGTFVTGKSVDYIEPLRHAFREKRMTLRDFSYDSSKAGGLEGLITAAEDQLRRCHDDILQWCRANFGEVFAGWIHLKIIRAFVESVLRYSLPVNILALFVEPNMKREKDVRAKLSRGIGAKYPELAVKKLEGEEEEEDDVDNLPYVFQKISLIGL